MDTHPDFLWLPTQANGGNPNVSMAKVKQLLELSRQTNQPTPTGNVKTYGGTEWNAAIPDNNSTAVSKTITVNDDVKITGLKVTVNITHTYIGDLKVTHFNPEESKDHWYQASLTVEGRIGNFELVYAGSYLDRNDFVASDYSDYSYWYDVLYGSGYYLRNDDGEFINPSQFIRGKDYYKMWSNELRLSSPRDQRFRFVVGAFAQQTSVLPQVMLLQHLPQFGICPIQPRPAEQEPGLGQALLEHRRRSEKGACHACRGAQGECCR